MPRTPLKERLFSSREIQQRVRELARTLSADYRGRDLLMIGVLKGAFMFMGDLAKRITIPFRMDFVRLASYGPGSESQGRVQVIKPVELPVAGKDVLIVEDIIDTGLTLDYFSRSLHQDNPRSVKICALIDKGERRELPVEIDYVGFTVPEGFLVGYGLDYDEQYRHLPALYRLHF
jgi:hypoxanthine phosphoribosyltransferase